MNSRADKPSRRNQDLLPSLFDRLKDDAPRSKTELASDVVLTPARLRSSLQRDLTWLLNTTNLESEENLSSYPTVASSVINYGLPAIAGSYLHSHKWSDIENAIKQAILRFEPRLDPSTLSVTPKRKGETISSYNVLLMEIRGQILTKPYPTEFLVQTSFDLENNQMSMQQT